MAARMSSLLSTMMRINMLEGSIGLIDGFVKLVDQRLHLGACGIHVFQCGLDRRAILLQDAVQFGKEAETLVRF